MTIRSPVHPPAMPTEQRRLQRSNRPQQIKLFAGATPSRRRPGGASGGDAGTLTGLMARLILEHARIGTPAVQTEASHDH